MAALASTFQAWSTTEGSNGPLGTDAPSLLDNGIRTAASVMRSRLGTRGTLASAATCDLGTKTEGKLDITDTTTITSFGTSLTSTGYGVTYVLTFTGILTLTNSASLACIGSANITTAVGDSCEVEYSSTGWTMLWYARKSGLIAAAAFSFGDGTVGAPSISFASDTDTGLYRSGANSMVAVANGVAQATFNASGLSATTATFTTCTGTNVVGSTNVRSPNVGSASGDFTIASATTTYNFDQAGGTALKFQQDGGQFAVIGTTAAKLFTAFSIPGAVGGAEPYQFGIGQHPSGAADTGAWSDVFFTANQGMKIDAGSALNDLLTLDSDAATVNAIKIFKTGPNNIWRVDKDGATFADGAYSGSGADYAEAFLPVDGYQLSPGIPVVLVADRVRPATTLDHAADIVGVVSARPTVIGDMALMEQGGVAVGLMGKLPVTPGYPVNPSWRLLKDNLYLVR